MGADDGSALGWLMREGCPGEGIKKADLEKEKEPSGRGLVGEHYRQGESKCKGPVL